MFQEVGGVRGVCGGIKPRRAVLSPGHCSGEPPCLGCRGGGAVGGVGSGGVRWGGVGSSSVVLYLPGCVRVCGGVLWGDAPRCRGVLLGLLGLCCCLKKGLSTRPGITHTFMRTHTATHTRTRTHDEEQTRRTKTEPIKEGEDRRGLRGLWEGESMKGVEEVKKEWKKRRERREAGHKRRKINRSS